MNNSTGVGCSQGAGNLYRNVDRSHSAQAGRSPSLPEGLAVDKFGRNKMQSIRVPEFVNGENVGMIQAEAARASCSKRRKPRSSRVSSGASILSATLRRRRVSSAR